MQPEQMTRPPRPSLIALLGDRRGATAIELALLGVPFVFLVLAIFELAVLLLVAGNLDTATSNAARQSGMAAGVATADGVATAICATMPGFGRDCGSALAVTLEPLATQPGQSAIVMVRAVYRWPLFSPLVAGALPDGGGAIALIATSAFRPEAS
jgi:Flp pilus assembly protein TadG